VAALIAVIVAPALTAACSQATEPPAPRPAYGEGIVSWSTVEKSMARQRAAQASTAPATPEQPTANATAQTAANTVTSTTEKRPATDTAPKPHDVAANSGTRPTRAASRAPKPVTQLVADTVASPITAPPVLALSAMPTPAPLAAAPVALMADAAAPAVFTPVPPVIESRIYSKDDADVIPARLLTTQGAAGLGTGLADVNTMELVVSPSGRVEEVKLAAPPKRMTDMLLLSGAKMWKFAPALKDGQPVRYRTQVSWETTR
jgi:hypothetical protein